LRNRGSVTPIQRLLQQLGGELSLPGYEHRADVELVIRFLMYSRHLHFDENLP